jgi:hypothetical protein
VELQALGELRSEEPQELTKLREAIQQQFLDTVGGRRQSLLQHWQDTNSKDFNKH